MGNKITHEEAGKRKCPPPKPISPDKSLYSECDKHSKVCGPYCPPSNLPPPSSRIKWKPPSPSRPQGFPVCPFYYSRPDTSVKLPPCKPLRPGSRPYPCSGPFPVKPQKPSHLPTIIGLIVFVGTCIWTYFTFIKKEELICDKQTEESTSTGSAAK